MYRSAAISLPRCRRSTVRWVGLRGIDDDCQVGRNRGRRRACLGRVPAFTIGIHSRNYVVIRGAVAQAGFGVSGDGRRPHLRVGAACGGSALNVITRRSRDGIPCKSHLQVGRGRRQPRGDSWRRDVWSPGNLPLNSRALRSHLRLRRRNSMWCHWPGRYRYRSTPWHWQRGCRARQKWWSA